ncbi:endo-1,4-beta-xylanase [Cellulomonas sp. zg-ZUI22]|uniref:endo-1,4-beta-xylanase n=1 Tax=Cellulomonas sp. zg-ZUI22 TaxID=2816955 RepID=UPI001A93FEE1|nr:endo-1,4-beta-xylanase [Cellulomonas sp. zg-ZUI22]MBO0901665.1 endo-1,4-beta-xylanase [Cellulomonas sp. zg-ZUI22]
MPSARPVPSALRPVVAAAAALVALALVAAGALVSSLATPAGALSPAVVLTSDFESGLDGWQARGAASVSTTATGARGAGSLLVQDRVDPWDGALIPVTEIFEPGTTYTIGLWLRLPDGAGTADLRVSVQRDLDGQPSYETLTTVEGVSSQWRQVTATYTPGLFDTASLYVESVSSPADVMVDDVLVSGVRYTPDLSLTPVSDAVSVPFGIAVEPQDLLGGRGELLAHHAEQITPGNQMKPDAIQPTEGTFTFAAADGLVDWAIEHDMRVYGHTLLWHQQTPDWFFQRDGAALTTSAADQALLRERLRTHIEAVADHYRETYGEYGTPGNPIFAFDVVNEVIDESQPDGLRRSEWYRVLGPSYIADAFRYARAAFGPEVLLFINDYNTEYPDKRAPYLRLVTDLLAQGVPVDGVGHQLHVEVGRSIPMVEDTIEAFEALDVTQAVTELDVSAYRDSGETWTQPPADRLLEQGYYYRDMLAMLERHASSFESITIWGLEDSRTWLRSGAAPLLFDGALQAKPAYWGIVDPSRIGATPTPTPSVTATPRVTPTVTPTPSVTPTVTPTPSVTPTVTATPSVTPTPADPRACRVAYTTNDWNTGFTAGVRVTNTGTSALSGWTLTFSLDGGQRVTQGWSASWTQSGARVTATNAAWNGSLAPGGSVDIGFNGSHTGSNPRPTSFALGGVPCAVG